MLCRKHKYTSNEIASVEDNVIVSINDVYKLKTIDAVK